MRYSLLLYYSEMTEAELGEEVLATGRAAFDAYAKALHEAAVLVSAEILQPVAAATTVRQREGDFTVQHGPFVETTEPLGGIFLIDVPELDAALSWAERCPTAQWGVVEIRPSALRFADGQWLSTS